MKGGKKMSCYSMHHNEKWPAGHHFHACCGHDIHSPHELCFMTKEQKISHLEEYLDQLKKKSEAVEEHINKLKEDK